MAAIAAGMLACVAWLFRRSWTLDASSWNRQQQVVEFLRVVVAIRQVVSVPS
jgi:hypothetical protein